MGIATAHGACVAEVLASSDVEVDNSGSGFGMVQSAIGIQTPIFDLAEGVFSHYIAAQTQSGAAAAATDTQQFADGQCSAHQDPTLNAGQLSSLRQIAVGADADTLASISFVSGG